MLKIFILFLSLLLIAEANLAIGPFHRPEPKSPTYNIQLKNPQSETHLGVNKDVRRTHISPVHFEQSTSTPLKSSTPVIVTTQPSSSSTAAISSKLSPQIVVQNSESLSTWKPNHIRPTRSRYQPPTTTEKILEIQTPKPPVSVDQQLINKVEELTHYIPNKEQKHLSPPKNFVVSSTSQPSIQRHSDYLHSTTTSPAALTSTEKYNIELDTQGIVHNVEEVTPRSWDTLNSSTNSVGILKESHPAFLDNARELGPYYRHQRSSNLWDRSSHNTLSRGNTQYFKCPKKFGYFIHSNRCDEYIECKNNIPIKFTCPAGLHFNPRAKWTEYPCDQPSVVKCDPASLLWNPPTTTAAPVVTTSNYASISFNFTCPQPNGYFEDAEQCDQYIECKNYKPLPYACPMGFHFNIYVNWTDYPCDHAAKVQCNKRSQGVAKHHNNMEGNDNSYLPLATSSESTVWLQSRSAFSPQSEQPASTSAQPLPPTIMTPQTYPLDETAWPTPPKVVATRTQPPTVLTPPTQRPNTRADPTEPSTVLTPPTQPLKVLTAWPQPPTALTPPTQRPNIIKARTQPPTVLTPPTQSPKVLTAWSQPPTVLTPPTQSPKDLTAWSQPPTKLTHPTQPPTVFTPPTQPKTVFTPPTQSPKVLTAWSQPPTVLTPPTQPPTLFTPPTQSPQVFTAWPQPPTILTPTTQKSVDVSAWKQPPTIITPPHPPMIGTPISKSVITQGHSMTAVPPRPNHTAMLPRDSRAITPDALPPSSNQLFGYSCQEPNGFYAVASKCDVYVECKSNIAVQHTCPDGLHFNPKARWPDYPCVYPSEVKCKAGDVVQEASPTRDCPHRDGFFPTRDSDCGSYLVCHNGVAILKHCPAGLVFNFKKDVCDWPVNVPECNQPLALRGFICPETRADDEDGMIYKYRQGRRCRNFVACQNGQPRYLSCDTGLAFDENTESCVISDIVDDCDA